MVVTVSPETEALIRKKVESGQYQSADDVIAAAMELLDARDRREYLRGLLREAEEEFRNGDVVEWTPELQSRLFEEAKEMVRLGVPPDPDVCP
ncbi:MAG: type II toxin-antitoxin system ParD family antitoxin [Thermomicrobiales bacterium]